MDNSMIAVVPVPIVAFASLTQELNEITPDDVLRRCGPPDQLANRHVEVDRRYFRPSEVDALRGDATKARDILGWEPRVSFAELVTMMVEHDIELARREQTVNKAGFADPARGAAIAGSD